jgi:predicted small secreted protein
MKSGKIIAGMLALALLAFGTVLAGCATVSSIGGTADIHGLISDAPAAETGPEIASYSVILGLLDAGYEEYAQAVKEAEASGRKISTVTRWYVIMTTTTAYAQ